MYYSSAPKDCLNRLTSNSFNVTVVQKLITRQEKNKKELSFK